MPGSTTPISELVRMYEAEGLSVREIAVRCSRTRQGIYLRLKRPGVELERRTSWTPLIAKDVLEGATSIKGSAAARSPTG